MKTLLLILFSSISLSAFASIPFNTFYIGADEKSSSTLTEVDFNRLVDIFEEEYGDEVKFLRDWEDGTVNAYAQIYDGEKYISIFGGFARFPNMTEDSFALVLCHELGHHHGGTPRMRVANRWASVEGQADYYATKSCMKRFYSKRSSEELLEGIEFPEQVLNDCSSAYDQLADRNICIRSAVTGERIARIFESFEIYSTYIPSILTPSNKVVEKTNFNSYPSTQCRLDTYFAGALCDQTSTNCLRPMDEMGVRPRCWFKPKTR